jgi:hypothetical protein
LDREKGWGWFSSVFKIENSCKQEFSKKVQIDSGKKRKKKKNQTGKKQVREGGYPFRKPTWLPIPGRGWVAIVGPDGWQLMDRNVGFPWMWNYVTFGSSSYPDCNHEASRENLRSYP